MVAASECTELCEYADLDLMLQLIMVKALTQL